MKHHTTDPAIKAQHIAERIEAETFKERVEQYMDGEFVPHPLDNWPQREIETYQEVLRELVQC